MKTILIVGASGFIGSNMSSKLAANDWNVIAAGRKGANPAVSSGITGSYISIDEITAEILSQCNAVMIFAGASLGDKPLTRRYLKVVYESRIKLTEKISLVIAQSNPKPECLISASAVGYYGDNGEALVTEGNPSGQGVICELCKDWESAADLAGNDLRIIKSRIGLVLDGNKGALSKMLPIFRYNLGGTLGKGKQWVPWIHRDDLFDALEFVLENQNINGAVNFVSPEPVKMNDFTRELAKTLGKPAIFNVPEFMIKMILRKGSELLLSSIRAVPEKLVNEGFEFKYKQVREAFQNLLR